METVNRKRVPLERDFIPGKRMWFHDNVVVYIGRSSTGAFVFETAIHEYISLWPFQLLTLDVLQYPKFDKAKWQQDKAEAEYKVWVNNVNDKIAEINQRIRSTNRN